MTEAKAKKLGAKIALLFGVLGFLLVLALIFVLDFSISSLLMLSPYYTALPLFIVFAFQYILGAKASIKILEGRSRVLWGFFVAQSSIMLGIFAYFFLVFITSTSMNADFVLRFEGLLKFFTYSCLNRRHSLFDKMVFGDDAGFC